MKRKSLLIATFLTASLAIGSTAQAHDDLDYPFGVMSGLILGLSLDHDDHRHYHYDRHYPDRHYHHREYRRHDSYGHQHRYRDKHDHRYDKHDHRYDKHKGHSDKRWR